MPPQYAQRTAYVSCDLQIGPCCGSGSHYIVSVSVPVGFVEEEVSIGQVTAQVIRFSPVRIIPPTLHTQLHVRFCYQKDKRAKTGNIKSFLGNREALCRKVL